jgi:hypothetical protein
MPQSSDSAGNSAYLLADVIRYDSSDRLDDAERHILAARRRCAWRRRADWQAAIGRWWPAASTTACQPVQLRVSQ